jgi:pimeloyl-ACP methyl ester carboxylesterase
MTITAPVHATDSAKKTPGGNGAVAVTVVAALATGLIGALFLTLIVFAAAPEHTITGAALGAFAGGWALLALGTSRWTAQPQRWAKVPAVTMGVTGVGLLVTKPGEGAMTTAGWFWPPVMLALAVWCFLRLRSAMRARARWLLYPVLGGMALASIGGAIETVGLSHDDKALVMPGHRYDIGGRSLHLTCRGSGAPTVVLVSGTSGVSASWERIAARVAPHTRVCAYDRAGQGWSDDAPHPQDGFEMADDLRRLLNVAGERAPFLFAGHSLGGVYSMAFAARYPDDVTGLVLLDSSSPEQFSALPDFPGQYQVLRRAYSIAAPAARLGIGRLLSTDALSSLPQPAAGQVRAFATSSRGLENVRDDITQYGAAMRQAQQLHGLDGKPIVVMTATDSAESTRGWAAAQEELVRLSSNALQLTTRASHNEILDTAEGADSATEGILRALQAVRSGAALADD